MILLKIQYSIAFASLCILYSFYIFYHYDILGAAQEHYPSQLDIVKQQLDIFDGTHDTVIDHPLLFESEGAILADVESDLTALCQSTKWTPGLWLHCHSYCGPDKTSICGGLNNARNRYQSCLRLAIDSGSGLILSSVTNRDDRDLRLTHSANAIYPDAWWDIQELTELMGEQCPGLKFRMCDDRSGIQHVLETPERYYKDTQYTNGGFRAFVEESLLNNSLNIADISEDNQVVVNFGDSHIAWNYRAAGELATIRKALFKVLNFNARLLGVSKRILQSQSLNNGAFIGVHLRGAVDWPDSYGTIEQQTWHYLQTIEEIGGLGSGIKTIYVSCGDLGAIQRFRDREELKGYEVLDKYTLLASDPELLREIDALSFDEKGIVEYHTLVGARFFLGIMTSTMSNTIAYARTINTDGDYFTDIIFPGSNMRTYGAPIQECHI